jgi:hypothetical protein
LLSSKFQGLRLGFWTALAQQQASQQGSNTPSARRYPDFHQQKAEFE